MITHCAARCGKQVIAQPDNRAYLCKKCWKRLFQTLFKAIRAAPEPHLQPLTKVEIIEKEVA